MAAKRTKFEDGIVAELNTLYAGGMTGIGKQYEGLIEFATKKTKLSDTQVKVSCVSVRGTVIRM